MKQTKRCFLSNFRLQVKQDMTLEWIKAFIKNEIVLVIAAAAALLSMLAVPVSAAYIEYFDLQVLALLFCLMTVVAGFQQSGVFDRVSSWLCSKAGNAREIGLVLVMLCFFSSMAVTNDVALITFVPFAILILSMTEQQKIMPYVIVLQTIAANLGSMLTPVGNPQNLYLYARYEMGTMEFFSATFPVTALSLVLLIGLCMLIPTRELEQHKTDYHPRMQRHLLAVSTLLFICCLGTVFRFVPWPVTFVIVLIVYFMVERELLRKVDYSLLATFVCFFVFTGNMGQIAWIQETLGHLMQGRELWVAALCSQVISNVPAAVLLSSFTDQGRLLLLGCDIGGLGTPVASLASLISYKAYCKYPAADAASYMKLFLLLNVVLLVVLLCIAQWFLI